MADNNYRGFFGRISPTVLKGRFGRRLIGALAFLGDSLAAGLRDAVRAAWIGDETGGGPAYDALRPAGAELSLPRYPNETWPQYHARLARAWQDWPFAGDEAPIIAQLAAAGFPGAQIFYTIDGTNWSRFTVFFPPGTHTVTAAGPLVGSFIVGDGTIVGPVGITPAQLHTIRAVIAKWKPGHWVCEKIVFQLSGWAVGDGSVVGAPGLLVGGQTVVVGAV